MDFDRRHAQQGVRLLEKIGEGTFGRVYKCEYKGKKCVVKMMKVEGSFLLKSGQNELKILKQMRHPRIVELLTNYSFNSMIRAEQFNFVLEYMENGSLRDILRTYGRKFWKFGQPDLLALFMDMVVGLKYLHSKGVIHRDLKPENVLADKLHRLKIADFGVSKITEAAAGANNHTLVGTSMYMAPEVTSGLPYDKSCDVWALGVIFFEMAMNKHPFNSADTARILNRNLAFLPPKIECQRRNYTSDVQDILLLMLQREPSLRSDLPNLCRKPIFSDIYEGLKREEAHFMNSP